MANPLQRGTKQYPNGTNVPKTGPQHSRGPAVGPQNNRPAARSTATAPTSATFQPFVGAVRSAGTGGPMSAGNTHSFDKLNTPIKRALGARGAQGPSRMLGGSASKVRPTSGGQ